MQIPAVSNSAYDPPVGSQSQFQGVAATASHTVSVDASLEQAVVFQTKEGDTVTLTSSARTGAVYNRTDAMGYTEYRMAKDGMSAAASRMVSERSQYFTLFDSRDMAITVEGDLSKAELADIKTAIREIDGLMTPLLKGDNPEAVIRTAEELAGLGTLASIEADYRAASSVTISREASLEQLTYARNGSIAPAAPDTNPWSAPHEALQEMAASLSKLLEKNRGAHGRMRRPLRQLFDNMRTFLR